jgi:putative ABC transport system permease protein
MRIPFVGIIGLALRRLRSRPALTLLSLLGVVLAVGLVSSVPVFAQAVSYLVLKNELTETIYSVRRPPLLIRLYYERRPQPFPLAMVRDMEDRLAKLAAEKTGLTPQQRIHYVESPNLLLRPVPDGPQYLATDDKLVFRGFNLLVVGGVEQEMVISEGQSFAEASAENRMPVWPHIEMCNALGFQVGEPYDLYLMSSDRPLPIYIAGVWSERDRVGPYWASLSMSRSGIFLVRPDDYERMAQPLFPDGTGFSAWYFISDESALTLDKVNTFASGLEILPTVADNTLPTIKMDVSPIEPMRRYVVRRDSLGDLLVNFSLPAIGLLFYFLSLLSTVIVQFQREETAIMGGRGAGPVFLLGITTVETLLLIIAGTPLGLAAGWLMVQAMGQTSGFLTFVERPGFPASLNAVNLRLLVAALVVLIIARLLPTLGAARKSVVAHLRERGRPVNLSGPIKLAVDVPLVLITAYAYRQLRMQEVPSLLRVDTKTDFLRDPLLLLAPLICVLTGALVLSHLFPVIMRPLDALSRRSPWLSVYMGVRRLYGQSGQYTSALFLVIICLSLGAFYSSIAMSVDQWVHDRTYYGVGADYTFKQGVVTESGSVVEASMSNSRQAGAWVLPISDYVGMEGVNNATRVGVFSARATTPRNAALRVRLMGIDRLTFPQVAFFRPDFAPAVLGDLLNRLGRVPNGLLVSRQFLKAHNVLEGQKLALDVTLGSATQKMEFTVAGAFDLWPTAYLKREETLVADLDYIFNQSGDPSQYGIWLNTEDGTSGLQLNELLQGMGVLPIEVGDAQELLRKENERAERIGIFGVLSIGFVAGSVLSWLGLLVYTSASMQGRMQQIGVLKAIGVQTHETLLMEGVEYVGVILYGVIGGIVSGVVASLLFVPFFQFNVTAVTAVPPFLPLIDWPRIAWFAVIFAGALLLSEATILFQTTRKDIFQALRMGQRE